MTQVYSTSTILRYTVALKAAINAALGDSVVVCDGPPSSPMVAAEELVWIGDVDGSQSYRALGSARRPREEEYTLDCTVSIVTAVMPDQTDAHTVQATRAFEILSLIEQAIRSNPTLGLDATTPGTAAGGYVLWSELGSHLAVKKRGNDAARETAVEFQVKVKAHL